ncbi:MAG TPA: Asp23/Gls24 family envelope stress response protein [Lactobacillaceae bacterium]
MAMTKKPAKNKNIILASNGEVAGSTQITSEVVEVIAQIATTEVAGVYQLRGSLQDRLARAFGVKAHGKGVEVTDGEAGLVLDVYIFVTYGAVVPKVALNVQAAIKNQIALMTDLTVDQVNVHVEGVVPEKADKTIDPNHLFDTTEADA